MYKSCPFCHKKILTIIYKIHLLKHYKRLPDGQMTNHMTEKPNSRYKGSLDNVPTSYTHNKCSISTGIPEDIIRSYLVNPFLYSDSSFCCGCNDYVDMSELYWDTSKENVLEYFNKLRTEYIKKYGSS